jgi:scavenger receptor class B protein 1
LLFIRLRISFHYFFARKNSSFQVSGAGLNTFVINNGAGFDANHVERVNNLGKIERFNDEPTLPYWTNEYANMINGTDSTLWHPDASKTERVYAYIPDICRSIYLEFNDTRANKFNIDTYHYTFPNTVFSNSPENVGFCLNSTAVNKTHELECLPSGLFSLKTCIHRKFINAKRQGF